MTEYDGHNRHNTLMRWRRAVPVQATPDAVRMQHGAMYRRLRRHMELHRSILSDDAWRLLTKVAFALYVDSRDPFDELTPLSLELEGAVTSGRR